VHLAASNELIISILHFVGLTSRLSPLAPFCMTLVIEVFYSDA